MIENNLRTSFRNRFWSYISRNLRHYGGLGYAAGSPGLDAETRKSQRLTEYAIRWAYYENKQLYYFLKSCDVCPLAMPTEYNPVPATVAFYVANVLGGELKIEGIVPEGAERDDANLVAAVKQVWDWSNFETMKQNLVETAAVLGEVFIKVAERTRPDAEDPTVAEVTGVYLQEVPPETVRYHTADERGYLEAIRIDTPRYESIFGGRDREHTLVEIWRKEWGEDEGGVRFFETEGHAYVKDDQLPDPIRAETFSQLGYDFTPVVWAETTTYWWSMTDQIDRYNRLALTAARFNRPLGVVQGKHTDSAGRPMPAARIDRSDFKAMTGTGESDEFGIMEIPSLSEFQWAGSPFDTVSHMARMDKLKSHIEESLPEYLVATLKITQVATETLQIALNQAGQRVLDMRGELERALVRAQAMALTIAQLAGLEMFARQQIGTYEAGNFDHQFDQRDVFAMPASVRAVILKELVAAGLPVKLALKEAGFDETVLQAYDEEAAAQANREQATLASALLRAQTQLDGGAGDNGLTRPELIVGTAAANGVGNE